MIANGNVKVNGTVVREMGAQVEEGDVVSVNGTEIQADAANQAAQRAVANSSLPTANKNAATIALDYNYQNGLR